MNIAVLGGSSHIAKGLIWNFLRRSDAQLTLFGRSRARLLDVLDSASGDAGRAEAVEGYDQFHSGMFDVVINCVGAGAPAKLGGDLSAWFTLTEEFDNRALSYLRNGNPEALYINFSSGAVYGRSPGGPCSADGELRIAVNRIPAADYYTIARLNAEAKHRSMAEFRIVDLRIFAYYSRFIDLSLGYFMSDVLNAVLSGGVLLTRRSDMVRDYIDPEDLYRLVELCIARRKINAALDAYSGGAAGKFEILERFSREFGLRYELEDAAIAASPNGEKNIYCSEYRLAGEFGYHPCYTALESLVKETRARLEI